jgi:predicted DCC family thiol-disulfide oxidoreductase YuxK
MGAPDAVTGSVVLFDGVCNLCNQSVVFIIKRDRSARFKFATLQSSFAREKVNIANNRELKSIVLLQDGKIFERSTAALNVARRLDGWWPILYAFVIVPPFIRNWIYDLVARNRYRLFGKRDACMIPTPEVKSRFIE